MTRASRCALVSTLVMLGCAPDAISLGPDPDFVFYTDHETGDLSAWNAHGTTWENGGGTLELANAPVRSGRYSVRSTIAQQGAGTQSAALLIAEGLPDDAYFSAWFYLPEPVSASYYTTLFKLASEAPDGTSTEVWVFDIDADPAGGTMRLYSDVHPDAVLDHPPKLSVGRWFQIEAFIVAPTPDSGELRVWVDGAEIFSHTGATMPTRDIGWVIGGGAEELDAERSAIYIDDAAVSRRRLGPGFPPFWRAN